MNPQRLLNLVLIASVLILCGVIYSQQSQISSLREGLQDVDQRQTSKLTAPEKPLASTRRPPPSAESKSQKVTDATTGTNPADSTAFIPVDRLTLRNTGETMTTISGFTFVGGEDVAPSTPRTREEIEAMLSNQPQIAGKGPRWSNNQVIGPPDTNGGGDLPTAWAPRNIQSGEQWLQVGYDSAVEIGSINVHETYNPGALSKVTAIMPDGSEKMIWQGTEPGGDGPVEAAIPVPKGITADKLKLYVDTNRVRSWPEIDAVEMVGVNGSRQWATSSKASSHYGDVESYMGQQ